MAGTFHEAFLILGDSLGMRLIEGMAGYSHLFFTAAEFARFTGDDRSEIENRLVAMEKNGFTEVHKFCGHQDTSYRIRPSAIRRLKKYLERLIEG